MSNGVNKRDEARRSAATHRHPKGDWKGGTKRKGKETMGAEGPGGLWKDPQGSNFADRQLLSIDPLAEQFEPTDAEPINLHKQMGGIE